VVESLEDSERAQLQKFVEAQPMESFDKKVVDQLKKRQLVDLIVQKSYKVTKGAEF